MYLLGYFDVFKCLWMEKFLVWQNSPHLAPVSFPYEPPSHAATLFNKQTSLDSHTWCNTSRHMNVFTRAWKHQRPGSQGRSHDHIITWSQGSHEEREALRRPAGSQPHKGHSDLPTLVTFLFPNHRWGAASGQLGLQHTDRAPERITWLYKKPGLL